MTVFVLIEEQQSEHGYVDTSIVGVFQHEHAEPDQREQREGHDDRRGIGQAFHQLPPSLAVSAVADSGRTTDAGWRSNVTTTDRAASSAAAPRTRSMIAWCPRCMPS